jgi:hypothetical protein
MSQSRWLRRAVFIPATLTTLFAVSACSGGSDYVDHGFEFDALTDSPGIQILEHKYGNGSFVGTQNPQYLLDEGRPLQRTNVWGHMRRPDSLYVKWRVASESKTYEDTVDLRKRLPREFAESKVYFMIRGAQLEVFLISMKEARPTDAPRVGPKKFQHLRVTKIYPN